MAATKDGKNSPKSRTDWYMEGNLPYDRIPSFKAAYDCYKKCQFHFRDVPVDSRPTAREVKEKLMRIMVCIAHARLGIRVLESLREATDLAIEIQITLRVLSDTHAISLGAFAGISEFSDSLVRQLVGWSVSEENKSKQSPGLFDGL